MAEEAPKIEQPTGEHTGGAPADVVAKAKVLAEAAQTAVVEHGDKVKAKVVGAKATDDSHDTESDTTQQGGNVKDKVVGAVSGVLEATKGYLNQGGSTDPAAPNSAPTEGKE